VIEALLDPLSHGATARALAEIVLLAAVGGTLGCWIVLYRLSYGAESLAHGLFPGLVLAALTGIPLLVGGAIGLIAAGLAVAAASRLPRSDADTGVAVVVTTMFGAGALLALSPESPAGVGNLLFGSILGVSETDLLVGGALVALILAALWVLHPRLLALGFDRGSPATLGARPLALDAALLGLIGLAILVAVEGLGNLLVVAVLVGPAATAQLLTHRVAPMMALATLAAALAGVGGIYLSYYADTAAAASIAGCIVALYLVALTVAAARPGHLGAHGYDR
jgi:ABC-type Mn2+/Zn2+ transport system permease subunit